MQARNKEKVIADCEKIINKYDEMIEHKLKGMAAENREKNQEPKPAEIIRTQQIVRKFRTNSVGHEVNGRKMIEPDYELYKTMLKKRVKNSIGEGRESQFN